MRPRSDDDEYSLMPLGIGSLHVLKEGGWIGKNARVKHFGRTRSAFTSRSKKHSPSKA